MGAEFDVYVRRNTWLYTLDPQRVKLALVAEAILFTFLWTRRMGGAGGCCRLPAAAVAGAGAGRPDRRLSPRDRAAPVDGVGAHSAFCRRSGANPGFDRTAAGNGRWRDAGPAAGFPAAGAGPGFLLLAQHHRSGCDGPRFRGAADAVHLGPDLALALRYLPILAGLFEQVREAQQARGLDLRQKRFFERLSAYRPVLIALLISALRNSERLGWAFEGTARLGNTRHPALSISTAASAPHGSLGAGRACRPAGRGTRLAHVVTV